MPSSDIICALTGTAATDDDLSTLGGGEGEDLPFGWLRITIERRAPNPKAVKLDLVRTQQRDAIVAQAVAAAQGQVLTPEQLDEVKSHAELITEAQFRYLQDTTPDGVLQVEQVYLAPFDRGSDGPAALDEYQKLRQILGLDLGE